MSLSQFKYLSDLGEGSFGRVIKAQRISDGEIYAIKQVKVSSAYQKELENTLNEIRILASITHQNIISYNEAFYEKDIESLCIVMELADGGDLQHKIEQHAKRKTFFEEKEVWRVAEQLLKGLKQLEEYKIIHRDIKSANIFFSKGIAKLGDMNVSKITEASFASTQTGTPYYASPEVWRGEVYSYKSDIWSLGCVLYEMCALTPPFKAKSLQNLNKKVQEGVYDRIPALYSSRLSNFIGSCLTENVNKRSDVHKLLKVLNCEPSNLLPRVNSSHKIVLKQIEVPEEIEDLNKLLPKPHYKNIDLLPETNILDKFLRVQQSPLHRRDYKLKQVRSQENIQLRSPKLQHSNKKPYEPISLKMIPDDPTHIGHLIKKKEHDIQSLKKRPIVQRMQRDNDRIIIKRPNLNLVNLQYNKAVKMLRSPAA